MVTLTALIGQNRRARLALASSDNLRLSDGPPRPMVSPQFFLDRRQDWSLLHRSMGKRRLILFMGRGGPPSFCGRFVHHFLPGHSWGSSVSINETAMMIMRDAIV